MDLARGPGADVVQRPGVNCVSCVKGLRSFSEYFEVGDRFPLLNPSYSVPLEG